MNESSHLDSRLVSPLRADPEVRAEQDLRPRRIEDFVGQKRIVDNLVVYMEAARARGEALDHILFTGLPGLGKTTMAGLLAGEMGMRFRATSGPVLERPYDLAGLLTNLKRGDVLFIDEIHRMNPVVEEYLYPAMEDRYIDIVYDKGPSARSVRLRLEPFTLVGATTRVGLLTAPFRARFSIVEKFEEYPEEDLAEILRRSAALLGMPIDDEAAGLVASRSRGTPRVANRLFRRIRDFAQVQGKELVDAEAARRGLEMLGIDAEGLDATDRKIVAALVCQFGAALGLKTLSLMVGEDERTLEDVYEPYLIRKGLLKRSPQGRMATPRARGLAGALVQPELFP